MYVYLHNKIIDFTFLPFDFINDQNNICIMANSYIKIEFILVYYIKM